MEMQKCEICDILTSFRCLGCCKVFYCSREHQVTGWASHEKYCRPLKIYYDDESKPYVVATREIKEKEIILLELPLVIGPSLEPSVVCVGCLNDLSKGSIHSCIKCGWPICNETCETHLEHGPECYYTTSRIIKVIFYPQCGVGLVLPYPLLPYRHTPSIYRGVLVLRCLATKLFDPEKWEKINKIRCNWDEIKNTSEYRDATTILTRIIYNTLKLEEQFTIDEIMKMWTIVKVHQEDLPTAKPIPKALYEISPFFEHNCKSNCFKSIDSNGLLRICAGVPISEGERLSVTYIDPLMAAIERQEYLQQNKYFVCKCPRCMDATEHGTFFSTFKCPLRNCEGILEPTLLPVDITHKGLWICSLCKVMQPRWVLDSILERVNYHRSLQLSENCIEYHIKKLILMKTIVSGQNSYIITEKIELIYLLGDPINKKNLRGLTIHDLQEKRQYCIDVLNIIQVLAPAENKVKGCILVHCQWALEQLYIRNQYAITNPLDYFNTILEEAVQCLEYEPIQNYLGRACTYAKKKLDLYQHFLTRIQQNQQNSV